MGVHFELWGGDVRDYGAPRRIYWSLLGWAGYLGLPERYDGQWYFWDCSVYRKPPVRTRAETVAHLREMGAEAEEREDGTMVVRRPK